MERGIKMHRGLGSKQHLHTLGFQNDALSREQLLELIIVAVVKAYDNHDCEWLLTNANDYCKSGLFLYEMATLEA